MKCILKLGSIALALPLMLAQLCQAQQWSGIQDLGGYGYLQGNPAAVQVPGTDVLQVFYHGDDNTVWTLWRNPADGGWSNAQSLGGQTLYWDEYGSSSPVAIQVPGRDVLQVFYRGKYDNHLWTRWRNTDGIWSPEEDLGGLLSSDPAVAQVPGTNLLQVFYQGQDGALWTRWRNTNGTWSNEQSLGGHLFVPTCADPTNDKCYGKYATPVAIQLPNTNALEVFYRGSDNTLRGFLRNQDGTWTPQYFGGELSSDPSAAPVPGTNQIEVFYRAAGALDGSLITQWGNPVLGSWTYSTPMAGKLFGYWCSSEGCAGWYAVPKAYVQPGTNNLWVFYRGQDGGTSNPYPNIWAQERTADGTWQPEFSVGGPSLSDITGVQVPGTDTMQIFYLGWICQGCKESLATQWYPN